MIVFSNVSDYRTSEQFDGTRRRYIDLEIHLLGDACFKYYDFWIKYWLNTMNTCPYNSFSLREFLDLISVDTFLQSDHLFKGGFNSVCWAYNGFMAKLFPWFSINIWKNNINFKRTLHQYLFSQFETIHIFHLSFLFISENPPFFSSISLRGGIFGALPLQSNSEATPWSLSWICLQSTV